MLAWAACLLLGLCADEFTDLADRRSWDDLMQLAGDRLEADPEDVAARYWLGRAQLERGLLLLAGDRLSRDLGRALIQRALETLVEVDVVDGTLTGDAHDWLLLARFELARSVGGAEDETLATELEQAWERERRPMAAALRAELAAGTDLAPVWWARAVEAEPDRPDLLLAWADALSAAGRRDEALAAWKRARDAGGRIDDLLATLLVILPGRTEAQVRLAELEGLQAREHGGRLAWHIAYALDQLGRLPEAAEVLARTTPGEDVDLDLAHAATLRRLGRHEAAAGLLLPWARRREWRAYDDLVSVADELALQRRWDQSLAVYGEALSVEDRDERARRNHVLTLYRAGREEEAAEARRALVALYPGRADVLNDAGLMAWGAGQGEESRLLLERAAALPGSDDARENLALLLLRGEPREADRAEALLRGVLDSEPDRARSLYLWSVLRSRP